MHDTRPSRPWSTESSRRVHRVVIACDDSRRRALMRLGLEMHGAFDVVGVAVEPRDVGSIVGRHRADVVVFSFARPNAPDVVDAVHAVHAVSPTALIVSVPVEGPLRPAPFALELAGQLVAVDGAPAAPRATASAGPPGH